MTRNLVALMVVCAVAAPAWAKEKDPVKVKAATSAELAKITQKWNEAKKQGPPSMGTCSSYAKDFVEVSKDNNVPEGHFNAGVLYEGCGDLRKAESAYQDALRVNPKFAPAIVNLGELLYRGGNVAEAERQFSTALQLDPKNVQAYNNMALILFERATRQNNDKNLINQAVQNLRRALAVDADSMAAYNLLALISLTTAESDRAKLELAELICKQAKEVDEKYAPIHNTLGLIRLKKKNVTGALQEFKLAAQYDPKYIEANLNIGAITLSSRDYKSAEEAFKAVLDAKPANPAHLFDATMGMGVALRGQRRVDEAEQWYAKAKQINAKDCAIAYNLGVLYQDYKSSSKADLNKAKSLFAEFASCGRASKDVLADATRRIKDIDDTFKALDEQEKMEAEAKKLAEEADRIQKQQEQQMQQQQKNAPAPSPTPTAPGGEQKTQAPATEKAPAASAKKGSN